MLCVIVAPDISRCDFLHAVFFPEKGNQLFERFGPEIPVLISVIDRVIPKKEAVLFILPEHGETDQIHPVPDIVSDHVFAYRRGQYTLLRISDLPVFSERRSSFPGKE